MANGQRDQIRQTAHQLAGLVGYFSRKDADQWRQVEAQAVQAPLDEITRLVTPLL